MPQTAAATAATTRAEYSRPQSRAPHCSRVTRVSNVLSTYAGRPAAFVTAGVLVLLWAVSGPYFNFDQTWHALINTATTIVTFVMVFVIQNSQNRDTIAMQIKLDELIAKLEGARESLTGLEELEDKELEAIREERKKANA